MASGRVQKTLCQAVLCLLVLRLHAQLGVDAHTEVAAAFPAWLQRRELKQVGQQATVPSIPPRACATLTPHSSVIQAALNASNAKAQQLKHQLGIESASALVTSRLLCTAAEGHAVFADTGPSCSQIRSQNAVNGKPWSLRHRSRSMSTST